MTKFFYGGDYYPEQWLDQPDILEKDIVYMKEAGMNVVSLGVFAWSLLEPEEGRYELDWIETIVGRLYENGISVMLATPSGARPKWLADHYPEVLRMNEDRMRNLFGARHNHCYTSTIYREKVRDINVELAKRFGKHPAVIMWHISNEFGGECHCPLCQQAFRNWLKTRYGTIEALNHSWWNRFWSHTYNSFDQIESPSSIGENAVHGLNLDWKRFVTDQTVDFLKAEINSLRLAGAEQPVTTNLMYDYKGLNYSKVAAEIDIVSWDTYPLWHKEKDIDIAWDNGMQHDYMRSLKHQPYLLMECCPTSTNWQGVSKLKKPGILMNSSLQTIGHGGDSVQYFQIRQSRGSSEKFHGAVIDHYGGSDTRVFREICQVGQCLISMAEIAGSELCAEAAVIYDIENRWAMEDAQGPRNNGLYYHEAALKSYQALRKYGLNVDVIDMEQQLDRYKIIAAPMLYMFRAGIEKKLQEFVSRGGILMMTYWSGIVDRTDLCFLGGTPHQMLDVLGIRREEIDGLYDHECNYAIPVTENDLGISAEYQCRNLCELVEVNQAQVLMTYKSDFYAGKAVLTSNHYGAGQAYYIGADMEQAFYDDIFRRILQKSNISRILPDIPENVEVSCRENEKYRYIFIQNFGKDETELKIPVDFEIVAGEYTGKLAGLSTLVVRSRKA